MAYSQTILILFLEYQQEDLLEAILTRGCQKRMRTFYQMIFYFNYIKRVNNSLFKQKMNKNQKKLKLKSLIQEILDILYVKSCMLNLMLQIVKFQVLKSIKPQVIYSQIPNLIYLSQNLLVEYYKQKQITLVNFSQLVKQVNQIDKKNSIQYYIVLQLKYKNTPQMNIIRKIKGAYDKQVVYFTKKQQQQKHSEQKMSIIQSDSLGMTIIDDNENQLNCQEIEPISPEQWVLIIDAGSMKGHSFQRIYFSFLKGIPTFLRYKIWLFFCSQNSTKQFKFAAKNVQPELVSKFGYQKQQGSNYIKIEAITLQLYEFLRNLQPLDAQRIQIDKDVHRTYSVKKQYKYTSALLQKVLYSLSNSGIQYSQGMNYILLNVIIYCLQSIGLSNEELFKSMNIEIQKNIFIIIREIVIRMDTVFGNNNIFKVVAQLEEKIAQSVPQVLYLIYKLGMDCFSMFSQHYFSLLSYNDCIPELSKLMMDLFFVVGQKAIHAIIVKMMEVSKQKILNSRTPEELNQFLKKELFLEYSKVLIKQQNDAKKLTDFGLSFYENRSDNKIE